MSEEKRCPCPTGSEVTKSMDDGCREFGQKIKEGLKTIREHAPNMLDLPLFQQTRSATPALHSCLAAYMKNRKELGATRMDVEQHLRARGFYSDNVPRLFHELRKRYHHAQYPCHFSFSTTEGKRVHRWFHPDFAPKEERA